MKRVLALGAVALALGGCAAGPYYDTYGYDAYGNPVYAGPSYDYYGAPYYSGPSVGFGYYYYDNDGHRQWHDGNQDRWSGYRDNNGQWHGNDNRGNDNRGNDNRGNWQGQGQGNHGRYGPGAGVNPDGSRYDIPDPRMSGPNPPNSGRVGPAPGPQQDPGAGR